jgi:hypothetical protein
MKEKTNPWKVATLTLICLSLILITSNISSGDHGSEYNFKEYGVSINKENFNSLTNILVLGQVKSICDTSNNKCVRVIKIG